MEEVDASFSQTLNNLIKTLGECWSSCRPGMKWRKAVNVVILPGEYMFLLPFFLFTHTFTENQPGMNFKWTFLIKVFLFSPFISFIPFKNVYSSSINYIMKAGVLCCWWGWRGRLWSIFYIDLRGSVFVFSDSQLLSIQCSMNNSLHRNGFSLN